MDDRTPPLRLLLYFVVIVAVAGAIVWATNLQRDNERLKAKAEADCIISGDC